MKEQRNDASNKITSCLIVTSTVKRIDIKQFRLTHLTFRQTTAYFRKVSPPSLFRLINDVTLKAEQPRTYRYLFLPPSASRPCGPKFSPSGISSLFPIFPTNINVPHRLDWSHLYLSIRQRLTLTFYFFFLFGFSALKHEFQLLMYRNSNQLFRVVFEAIVYLMRQIQFRWLF